MAVTQKPERKGGEQLYCGDEFASRDDAINRAKMNALDTVKMKFRSVSEDDIDWMPGRSARLSLRKSDA